MFVLLILNSSRSAITFSSRMKGKAKLNNVAAADSETETAEADDARNQHTVVQHLRKPKKK